MAYFPKFGPFYDPQNEQEIYGERDGRLRLRYAQLESRKSIENGFKKYENDSASEYHSGNRKPESDWTGFLQNHGNLFYIESTRHADRKQNLHETSASKHEELSNNHSRQSSHSSDRNDSPRINQTNMKYTKTGGHERQSSVDNESLGSSGSSFLNERHHFNKSINTRFNREDRQRCSDGSSQSDQSYTTFSEYLDESNGPPKTSQKRQGKVTPNSKGFNSKIHQVSMNQNQSGKRKSIMMVPNVKNIDNIHGCTGVYLCEKLFGIKLCNYKDKPPRPNGSSVEQILRDRKVIVQGVIQDSQADICNQIHRGDMLVGINDVGVTWVNIDELIRSMSYQAKVKLTFQVPLVIGPKQTTPPVTPTRNTPPLAHQPDHSQNIPTLPQEADYGRNIPSLAHQPEHSRNIPTLPQEADYGRNIPSLSHQPDHSRNIPTLPQEADYGRNIPSLAHQPNHSRNIPPPVPPHIPLQAPVIPARQPQHAHHRTRPKLQDIVYLTTGETVISLDNLLNKYLFSVMYLTFGNQTEGSKDDIIYQYPTEDNKLLEIRGLFVTLTSMMKDVTNNHPKLTTVRYRGLCIHTVYWRYNQDVLVFCIPESRVPDMVLSQIFTDFTHIIQWLHGSVKRVFEDEDLHGQLDQLISLILYRVLLTGVGSQSIPNCSPLEPQLIDLVRGIRELQLAQDDKVLCDEILSEFEAQDYMELEEVDPDLRRKFGILGSCLFYKDYLLCSHLNDGDLQDIHLFLKYHAILYLVNKQPVEKLVLWREIYPTRLCNINKRDWTPAYTEPKGRWFMLVVGMKHFLHCTILETGGYASHIKGQVDVDPFVLEKSRTTLTQLITEDTDIDQQCHERLFSEKHGPKLKSTDIVHTRRDSTQLKSPSSRSDGSPRYGNEESDRISIQFPDSMNKQGSRLSRSSNDSNGSSGSAGINKNTPSSKKGSVYDVALGNRSFTENHQTNNLKVTRSFNNLLLHYVRFDKLSGVYVSPTPCDLLTVQGPTHEHVLYNFYGCCVRIHKQFECVRQRKQNEEINSDSNNTVEEAVMFTCQANSHQDSRRPAPVLMYWVIGRLFTDDRELFVCIEDGAPQTLLELAFTYQFGLS